MCLTWPQFHANFVLVRQRWAARPSSTQELSNTLRRFHVQPACLLLWILWSKSRLTDKLIGLKTLVSSWAPCSETVRRRQHTTGLRSCGLGHALLATLCGRGDWIRGLALRPFLNRVGASSSNTWTSSLRPSVEAGQSVRRGRWKMIINNEISIYHVKQGGLQLNHIQSFYWNCCLKEIYGFQLTAQGMWNLLHSAYVTYTYF